jgi:hypothetical protein
LSTLKVEAEEKPKYGKKKKKWGKRK